MRFWAIPLVLLGCLATIPAWAESGRGDEGAATVAVEGHGQGGAAGPVAVPEPSRKAVEYYKSGNVLWIVWQLAALAIPSLVLFTGLSARMRDLAGRIGRKWFFIVAAYFVLYSLLEYVLYFPLVFYAGYIRQHAYGLSNQTLWKWWTDSAKSLGVGIVFGCLIVWAPYLLIRRSPRRWWLYSGLFALPLLFLVMLVEPIWVEPLFNRFEPLKNKPLEGQILALAKRAGIEGGRVFEVDKSVDTKAVNAYVTGLWGTKRIVLWDTLLKKLNTGQILFIMAHEMGHYVLNHVLWGILVGFVGILFGLYLIHRFSAFFLQRGKRRFGFDRLSDVASLPLVLLLGQLISLAIMPIGLAYSRHIEHEADRFGLELTENNHAAATAFVRLQDENLGYPRPGLFCMLWRGSHPSLAERIEFANDYHPWTEGKPLRYGSLFEAPSQEPHGQASSTSAIRGPHGNVGRIANPSNERNVGRIANPSYKHPVVPGLLRQYLAAISLALLLGIQTAIGPCPLAANIAAISYIGRRVGSPRQVLWAGLLYTAGRTLVYVALGIALVAGLLSVPRLSMFLQEHINQLLGPILMVAAMVLLELIPGSGWRTGASEAMQRRADTAGVWGAGLLGILLALAFCPVSAAWFFLTLIPLAVKFNSSVMLPSAYGVGTALPVAVFAGLAALSARSVGKAFNAMSAIERWARRISGGVFLLAGFYFSLRFIFGVF